MDATQGGVSYFLSIVLVVSLEVAEHWSTAVVGITDLGDLDVCRLFLLFLEPLLRGVEDEDDAAVSNGVPVPHKRKWSGLTRAFLDSRVYPFVFFLPALVSHSTVYLPADEQFNTENSWSVSYCGKREYELIYESITVTAENTRSQ